ncbi:ABC transporter permease [Alloacidobacterium sp.]|uniref:ABC transporter permease n=1 Tax=Alloacidobacterium sp. TaxID=2951999 RepID=UPI002D39BA34|nr:FtsX-like permease family protein [Alloacidobacterium sp.]HYK38338.1 FtsX-like permease family protein [Alloacidobacterium sp.]
MGPDQKPALAWSTAAKIAWRELRASRAKFVFVILSVAIGVAALTGVRGFSESFQKALLDQARSIMAADLSARMFRLTTQQENVKLDALAASKGIERTSVTEMVSMASLQGDPVPLLVSLKVVDPARYPFYGKMILNPGGDLRSVLTDSTVVVDDNLLVRLRAKIGDTLKIGGEFFKIAAVIEKEPDRLTAGIGLGPRVMMTRTAVNKTGLLQQGSRATERYLFKLGPQSGKVADIRSELEKILPEAQITDFRETSPSLAEGLDHATGLLSLICLVAMVLGAIGVGMAMRAHLQQRIDILAIMKSIGAKSSDILRIYLLQTLLLGASGGLIGIACGLGVEWALPFFFGKLLPIQPPLRLPVRSVSAAFGTGILTTVLFCLPPLLDVRKIRPSIVLRKSVEGGDGDGKLGFWKKIGESKAQWISVVVIVLALAGIAAGLANSMLVGKWFAAALCGLLVVILGLAALTLRTLRAFLNKTRLHLHSALRHGLANLYRPGNQSAAVLAALGTGVMLILSVFLMQHAIVNRMNTDVAKSAANIFLIDISQDEVQGVKDLLLNQPGVDKKFEAIPIVSARITSIDGVPVDQLKIKNYPKRLLSSVSVTWADSVPEGVKVTQGKWWQKSDADGLAVVDHLARRLNLHPGSSIDFESGEKTIHTKVAVIYKPEGEHVFARSEFILPSGPLQELPNVWYAAVHVQSKQIPFMERALFAAYPTVTVINIADILDTVQGVVHQITLVIRFLAAFSILSGAIILASSVASTRFRRIREVVVLKTLGATRNRIAAVFSIEFVVLGLLAGVVGVIFANLLSRVLLHRMEVPFHVEWTASGVSVIATAVLAVATGWIASFRILGQKPLEVLREE